MNRFALAAAIALGLVLASLPFVHYRVGHHAAPDGGPHAHHAH